MACQKSIFITYSRSPPFSGSALLRAAAPAEELREDIAEAAAAVSVRASAAAGRRRRCRPKKSEKSKPPKSMPGCGPCAARRPGAGAGEAVLRIEAELVVHLALLGVAQDVVGFLNVLEALLGGLVPGIQIGMILARELPVRLADLVRGGLARNAQRFVIVVLGSRP